MKKIYFLISGLLLSTGAMAQQVANGGFESWTSGAPDSWYSGLTGAGAIDNDLTAVDGGTITINGSAGTPVTESTTDPAEGTSSVSLQSFSYAGGSNLPDGLYGASMAQTITTTEQSPGVEFQYKTNLVANDTAFVYIEAKGAPGGGIGQNGDIYGIGALTITANSAVWVKDTAKIQYLPSASITSIEITFVSSKNGLYVGTPPAVDGSIFELDAVSLLTAPVLADPVSNIVASDISDNGNGTDLQVTFDAAADEGTVSEYRIFVIDQGLALGDWSGAPSAFYETVTPDGSASYTHTFSAASTYAADQGGSSVAPEPIAENIPMDVYVLSVADGTNANGDQVAGPSNTITLGSVGLSAESISKAVVYPNPAQNQVNVITGFDNGSVVINAVTGQVVANGTIANGTSKIDVSNLQNGVYIYTIRNNDGEVITTNKLVIK